MKHLVVRTLLNYEAYVSKQFVSGKQQCFSVKIYDYSVILLPLHTVSLIHKNPKKDTKKGHMNANVPRSIKYPVCVIWTL